MSRLNDAEPVLKSPEAELGRQSVGDECHQLKLPASDGKNYLTDVATAETLLRLVRSIPSPKAEPIKLWLAKVGYRMQEIADPALASARENWRKPGRSEKWITQRMTGQETRNKLTDYWVSNEVQQGQEFAILNPISLAEKMNNRAGRFRRSRRSAIVMQKLSENRPV